MRRLMKSVLFLGSIFGVLSASAQIGTGNINGNDNGSRVVTTTVPFLAITPDSRSGAMADAGVALSPDANSMYWNPAKIAFAPNDMAFSLTYTPWLRKLVPDISLSYLSMYKKIDKLSGFGASLRYFSLGDINFTNDQGQPLKTFRPYEYSLDAGYARQLSSHFSIGVAGRFIYSNLAGQTTLSSGGTSKPGYTLAGDISAYYTSKIKMGGYATDMSFGGNISNIGGKITYTASSDRDFIPANLRLGTHLNMHINEYNDFAILFDINKLLVPSPPIYQYDANNQLIPDPNNPGHYKIAKGMDPNVPVMQGVIQSFYDAPGGGAEELREINPSLAFEYWYMKQFALRAGYFYEAPDKGNRQYMTVGIGVKYNVMTIDVSYLIPTNGSTTFARSPLENTLRFTLQFSLDKEKKAKNAPATTAPSNP